MEKTIKYFLWAFATVLIVSIVFVMNMPKQSMTIYDVAELKKVLNRWNSVLPQTIGTIGTMDSIVYHNNTITYNMTVSGDNGIKEVYKDNYDKFKDILKYSILTMNGQHNMGDLYATLLDQKGLCVGFRVYTQDGDLTEWNMSGHELNDYVKACRMNPTAALCTAIDIQIEIANINLPVKLEDIQDPIKSVALNTFLGDLDENCLPQSVSHIGEDIIFEYNVAENAIDLEELENVKDNPEVLDAMTLMITEDEDAHEFLGLIAISHSSIVIKYEGRYTHKVVSIRIPYYILKKHCKIPQIFLS